MATTITPIPPADLAQLTPLVEAAQTYANNAQSDATKKAYSSDWADFEAWCAVHGVKALPASPATVALYVVDLINRCAVATLARRLAAITHEHRRSRLDTPTASMEVRTIMRGIKRTHGTQQHGKAAAVTEDVRAMVAALPSDLGGTRDRALLLIGFAAALRRSELVALDVANVQFRRDGLTLHIKRSKTDQERQGATLGVVYGNDKTTCPVRSLKVWLQTSGIQTGAIFRPVNRHNQLGDTRLHADAVGRIVKRCAAAAGLDPEVYGGHSLRVGLVTSAVRAGVSDHQIMDQTRHKDQRMVRRYRREANVLGETNVTRQIGL